MPIFFRAETGRTGTPNICSNAKQSIESPAEVKRSHIFIATTKLRSHSINWVVSNRLCWTRLESTTFKISLPWGRAPVPSHRYPSTLPELRVQVPGKSIGSVSPHVGWLPRFGLTVVPSQLPVGAWFPARQLNSVVFSALGNPAMMAPRFTCFG